MDVVPPATAIQAGETFELAVVFRIEPQWHIYWVNAGAGGLATDVRTRAPQGFEVGDLRWPAPRAFSGEEGITYGYEHGVALFVPITAPATLPSGPLTFDLSIDWLVCRGICLTGSARRSIDIEPEAAPAAPNPLIASIIEQSRHRVPRPLADLDDGRAELDGTTLRISGRFERSAALGTPTSADEMLDRRPRFYPLDSSAVVAGTARVELSDDHFWITVPLTVRPENSEGRPLAIGGVVAMVDGRAFEFRLELPEPGEAVP